MILLSALALADPCGMVPPIAGTGELVRDGIQRTYVLHRDGVEVIGLRPGFVGDVSEFGMLIPFPEPPQIRKLDEDFFAHLEAAIDPPELTLRISRLGRGLPAIGAPAPVEEDEERPLTWTGVSLIREEAVGMYQVAVLQAGSADALARWMTDNGYRYPAGMDAVVAEYVAERWSFVAVKARVGGSAGLTPRPGMRTTSDAAPPGGRFDGHVQGMAFRFASPEVVIPMRLSVFNGPDPHNVVYVLADEPVRLSGADEGLVARQVSGATLRDNLTAPLPLTVRGGSLSELSAEQQADLAAERDPARVSGLAGVQIAADLEAIRSGRLSLPMESEEKALLSVSEALGMRGAEVDALHAEALAAQREAVLTSALGELEGMWMTVIDGVIPGALLAGENLTVSRYRMPAGRNVPREDPLRVAERALWVDVP